MLYSVLTKDPFSKEVSYENNNPITPRETNMTMEIQPFEDVSQYLLRKKVMFH